MDDDGRIGIRAELKNDHYDGIKENEHYDGIKENEHLTGPFGQIVN